MPFTIPERVLQFFIFAKINPIGYKNRGRIIEPWCGIGYRVFRANLIAAGEKWGQFSENM
jgi:hypothetical protein